MSIEGDSGEYEFLTEAVALSANLPHPTVEIGVRKGLGSSTIMDAIVQYCPGKTHIGIDPYGSIEYIGREMNPPCRLDYTDEMMKECMADLYKHIIGKPVNFVFHKMTDSQYFVRYARFLPLYDLDLIKSEKYSMVHFDGPHTVDDVLREIAFFHEKTDAGATYVFDDVTPDFYDHSQVDEWLLDNGYIKIREGYKKAIYQKL